MVQKEIFQIGVGRRQSIICFSAPWNCSKEQGWRQRRMGCWIKDGLADLLRKTVKSRGISLSETPYPTQMICVYFCLCLKFSVIKSLKKLLFCLEFQEIGESIMWSRANAYLISQWVLVGMGIREEKSINQIILCEKWRSKCLMVKELILRGRT